MELLLTRPLALLPWPDWLALAVCFGGWIGYAHFARLRAAHQVTILGSTNRWRARWMLQTTGRGNRIVDAAVTQSMAASPSFFASTSILIIGGLLAALASSDKAIGLARELPFAARTSVLVFDLKLVLLTGIFIYAFFCFTWSVRQYSFGVVLIGAAPEPDQWASEAVREDFVRRSGRVMGLAAEAFNDGLRGYYLSFAAVGWFFSPWVFLAGTVTVLAILYRREFLSEVLDALSGELPPIQAQSGGEGAAAGNREGVGLGVGVAERIDGPAASPRQSPPASAGR